MIVPKKGSMTEIIGIVFRIVASDEELLRLLYYYPETNDSPNPLSSDLPNLLDREDVWDIINDRIKLTSKVSDLENNPLCRLYITAGRRRPSFSNYLVADQEIVVNIYTHEDYEEDGRSTMIMDRLNELLALERFDGMMGILEYVGGNPRGGMPTYQRYEQVYQYVTKKK